MRAFMALLLVVGLSGIQAAPVDHAKLEALKEKLRALHDVLDQLNTNIGSLEESQDKREFAPLPPPADPEDAELDEFLNQLSPEDAALVEKMKSKLKFLQATVHEEPGVDVPAEDGFAEEQPIPAEPAEEKRDMQPEFKDMYSHMSEEDQQLLKDHPSMWSHLDKALRTSGGNAADAVAAAADDKRAYENDVQNQLSDDDQELLRRMKSKLSSLKSGMRSETEVKSPVNEVQRRLLEDVRYAKENGVSLKQVLKTLVEAKRNRA